MTTVGGVATELEPATGSPRPATRAAGAWWFPYVAYLAAQAVTLVLLRLVFARLFFIDDKVAQYIPAFRWMGGFLTRGELPPLNDPAQGEAGNYAADLQYGVLDPAHWVVSFLVAHIGNLNDAAWLMSAISLVVLGLGVVALLRHAGVRASLSVAVAVGAATSGTFLWLGAAWWPLSWGTALLPWLWLGLVRSGKRGIVLTAVAAWLIAGSGYPYAIAFSVVVVAGWLVELFLGLGRRAGIAAAWPKVLAGLAGAIASAPGILLASQLQPYTQRVTGSLTSPTTSGFFVPNLGDVLLGGSTLTPQVTTWNTGTGIDYLPLAATLALTVPALAFLRWREAWRSPLVLTAAALVGAGLLASQLPESVLSFRYPVRYLAIVGVGAPILVALLHRRGVVVSRPRVILAVGLLAAQIFLAWSRAPVLLPWHLLAAGIAAVAVASLLRISLRERGRAVAAIVLVATAVAGPVLGLGASISARNYFVVEQQGGTPAAVPAVPFSTMTEWSAAPADYRDLSVETDSRASVYVWNDQPARGWGSGVLQGNGNLVAGFRPGFGYTSVGQSDWAERLCQDYLGAVGTCGDDEAFRRLLAVEQTTGRTWLDLVSQGVVYVSANAPDRLLDGLEEAGFTIDGTRGDYTRLVRSGDLPTDVSYASDGVSLTARAGDAEDRWTVSTGSAGGTIVLPRPYWPGYVASVDGRPVDVTSVEGTTVAVRLPAGLDGATLRLDYAPTTAKLLVPALVAGALLTAAAAVLPGVIARRRRRSAAVE